MDTCGYYFNIYAVFIVFLVDFGMSNYSKDGISQVGGFVFLYSFDYQNAGYIIFIKMSG